MSSAGRHGLIRQLRASESWEVREQYRRRAAARPLARPWITVPDGRQFKGRYPHLLGSAGEGPYIAELAEAVDGIAEVILPAGRADVATNTDVFEVEPVATWVKGAQQAFAYGGMSGLHPAVALFGEAEYLPIFLRVRDQMPGLTLWVFADYGWRKITSRRSVPSRAASKRVGHRLAISRPLPCVDPVPRVDLE